MTGEASHHFWLTRGVARALGVSFTEAMLERRLDETSFARLVSDCRHCPHAAACVEWLARNGAGASCAPGFCRNGPAIEALVPRRGGPSSAAPRPRPSEVAHFPEARENPV